MSLNINWDEIIKKEARGIEDYDLGEVDAVSKSRHSSYQERNCG
jgi:hypothetical protein